jgi:RNA polymerase sigma-70 factor (ECF subfamily)
MSLDQLKELFNKHKDMVFRVCLRYTGNREDAEDMVQDVFLKVHNSLSKFSGRSSILTWIYRIAVNRCLDSLREKKRKKRLQMENMHELVVGNVESQGDECLAKLTVEKILEEVNSVTREILFMTYAEGLTHQEISGTLGISRVAVTRRLTRFKEQMPKNADFNANYHG